MYVPWWTHPDWPELLGLLYDHSDNVPAARLDEYDEWRFGLEAMAGWFDPPLAAWRDEALAWGFPADAWDLRWRILLDLSGK
jgi:hypothetical protein